jgi:FPC/CPF motif-containing protein YcgG
MVPKSPLSSNAGLHCPTPDVELAIGMCTADVGPGPRLILPRRAPGSTWDPIASSDPESKRFAFSFARRAFFVVGLNPTASRYARRSPWPCLVFNPHEQLEKLRAKGALPALQAAIRARDIRLQGSVNSSLDNFGDHSEARQYAGRQVELDWRCPFHPGIREDAG